MKAEWSDWGQTYSREMAGVEDAVALIAELSSSIEVPAMVEFYGDESGRALAIGVGREVTVVTYQDSLDPPYFISLGDGTATKRKGVRPH